MFLKKFLQLETNMYEKKLISTNGNLFFYFLKVLIEDSNRCLNLFIVHLIPLSFHDPRHKRVKRCARDIKESYGAHRMNRG